MYKDQNQQHLHHHQQQQQQQQQKVKAWESTVRRSQQQHQPGNRRRFFSPMSVAPADDDSFTTNTTAAVTATTTSCSSDDDDPSSSPLAGADDYDAAAARGREQGEGAGKGEKLRRAERLLANGDFYTGQWSGGVPHGVGKYLWSDGCMYEGDWRHGKTTGGGKFSWPSGATYEGEFKAGFMDGQGTYTGASGDTYRGAWSMNLKHGHGTKSYANGDFYDGEWRSGLQDGHGRYVWRNGTEYIGQWRAGLIHGRGSIVWANGNRYDGGWDDGWPRGNGNFRWADGSLYVGTWTKENAGIEQKGVYYPSPTATSPTVRDPQDAFAADLKECRVSPGEAVSILPSQKPLNWSGIEPQNPSKTSDRRRSSADHGGTNGVTPRRPNGRTHTVIGINDNVGDERGFDRICIWESNGDITCDIVDRNSVAAPASSREREGTEGKITGRLRSDERDARASAVSTPRAGRWPPSTPAKKQGITISKGHKNYELMLNLQLGIRHAVGKQGPTSFDLKSSAFDPREKVWTRFPPEGSKHTPPHQSCDFRWKDYCPLVFRTLRRLFKVDPAEYMMSLCGNDALRELSSPGKSGSFFYLTQDDRYMIKTMKKAEVKVLLRMLPAYYKHVSAFENTLVTKFYGLHCVKLTGASQKKVRFVIMGNLFCSEFVIHRRFDLKGSSLGRVTSKPESEIDQYTTLKDLDLNFIFRLKKSWFQEFQRQIDKDSEFLEQERIMDYSLLVGVHFKSPRDTQLLEGNTDVEGTKDARTRLSRVDMDQILYNPNRCTAIRLGINMQAKAELTVRRSDSDSSQLIGEPTGEFYEVVLFFGIIDILQEYDISKRVEHVYKSFQYDPTSISAVDPKQYARRFRDFIHRAFTEDT